jgi:hypothetical protein
MLFLANQKVEKHGIKKLQLILFISIEKTQMSPCLISRSGVRVFNVIDINVLTVYLRG